LKDEIRKETSNKKRVKIKQIAIKNKDQFCHKKNELEYWGMQLKKKFNYMSDIKN